jgi:integrase
MIRRPTLKSRRRKRVARIAIGPELAELLDACPQTAVTVVTTEAGRPFASPRSFSRTLERAMARAGVRDADGELKHLHDFRGTRATLLFAAGATDAEAEAWFGWAPGAGAKMRDVYGDPETIAVALARRLERIGR